MMYAKPTGSSEAVGHALSLIKQENDVLLYRNVWSPEGAITSQELIAMAGVELEDENE
jgi:hypothetical protein